MRGARWYRPEGRVSFSLLPDCLLLKDNTLVAANASGIGSGDFKGVAT
jgi:hypothetical protein